MNTSKDKFNFSFFCFIMVEDSYFWELSRCEKTILAVDLQEAFIDYWHNAKGKPDGEAFNEHIGEQFGVSWRDTGKMLEATFGSYNNLVRSMGEAPRSNSSPQDTFQRIQQSNLQIPITYSNLRKETEHPTYSEVMSSHAGMMEALGVFEEYVDLAFERAHAPERQPFLREALRERKKDRESIVENIEQDFGKSYDEMDFKYSI